MIAPLCLRYVYPALCIIPVDSDYLGWCPLGSQEEYIRKVQMVGLCSKNRDKTDYINSPKRLQKVSQQN